MSDIVSSMFDRVYDRAKPERHGDMTLYDPDTHTAWVHWDDGVREHLEADCLREVPRE